MAQRDRLEAGHACPIHGHRQGAHPPRQPAHALGVDAVVLEPEAAHVREDTIGEREGEQPALERANVLVAQVEDLAIWRVAS